MRVLVQIRPNERERTGGDTVHALRKAEELRALGVEVVVTGDAAPDPSAFDLVHLYNTAWVEPTLRRALRARGCGVPVVIETIYWDTSFSHPPFDFPRQEGMRRVALAVADRLIPSSNAEAAALEERYPHVAGRLRVVPVGIDKWTVDADSAAFCRRYDVEPGFVLCAGRKELRKNQLRLIRACAGLGAQLVLAGGEHPEAEQYLAECRAAAESSGADVRFVPHLDEAELAGAYAAAGVHAQPSIWETVGLSSLEAAMLGCKVVTTRQSGIVEYLDGSAWYCDPLSEESIAEALAAALAAPRREGVAERLRREFSWRRAAEETLVAYEEAMTEHAQRGGGPPLPQEQYVEHLEELVQLQLEAIAFREERLGGAHAHAEALGVELEAARAALRDSQQAAEDVATLRAQLQQEREHLARLQETRLFRWSAPFRATYARLRRP